MGKRKQAKLDARVSSLEAKRELQEATDLEIRSIKRRLETLYRAIGDDRLLLRTVRAFVDARHAGNQRFFAYMNEEADAQAVAGLEEANLAKKQIPADRRGRATYTIPDGSYTLLLRAIDEEGNWDYALLELFNIHI